MNTGAKFWAIVPAAGMGKRVGNLVPKQYLDLNGRPLIEWSLSRLLEIEALQQLTVVVSAEDEYWNNLKIARNQRIQTITGGEERSGSVLNGLESLSGIASDDDWILVHDAARPCIRITDIHRLIDSVMATNHGGILAVPVRDTIKMSDCDKRVKHTLDRNHLWHSLTPQIFRYGELKHAVTSAINNHAQVTDEAAAMERVGQQPRLIEGASDNIKVTFPEDIALASFFMASQGKA